MTNAASYPLASAKLVDAAIEAMNARLETLSWLDTAYGVTQRLTKQKDGVYNYPAIYVGGDYYDLLPDEHLISTGGYSFWNVAEPVTVNAWRQSVGRVTFTASLIVWCDLRLVYPNDWQGRTWANVADDVIQHLKSGTGRAQLDDDVTLFHEGQSIYSGYTNREIDRQFLQKPYAGFRIEAKISYITTC